MVLVSQEQIRLILIGLSSLFEYGGGTARSAFIGIKFLSVVDAALLTRMNNRRQEALRIFQLQAEMWCLKHLNLGGAKYQVYGSR